jgi:hypothetical protein
MNYVIHLVAALLVQGADQSVLTRDGKRHVGRVSLSGTTVVIEGADGKAEAPADQVIAVYGDPADAVKRADALYDKAKAAYESGKARGERDAKRNTELQGAIDMAALARDIFQGLARHHTDDRFKTIPAKAANVIQFIRLCRDQKGSDKAGSLDMPELVPLERGDYGGPTPSDTAAPAWTPMKDELGTGLGSAAAGLESRDPAVRLESAKRLAGAAAPWLVPALLKQLDKEGSEAVIKAIGDALAGHDLSAHLKSMAWAKKCGVPVKRILLTNLLKRAGDKAACEFLVAWLVETPPVEDASRAAICSAFRKMREDAVPALRSAIGKNKDVKVQAEILIQMGMMRDKRNALILVQALKTFKVQPLVGLLEIGLPALPAICDGCGAADQDPRKYSNYLARRLTGLQDTFQAADFKNWYVQNHQKIEDDDAAFWTAQAKEDYPVDIERFKEYSKNLQDIVR